MADIGDLSPRPEWMLWRVFDWERGPLADIEQAQLYIATPCWVFELHRIDVDAAALSRHEGSSAAPTTRTIEKGSVSDLKTVGKHEHSNVDLLEFN